MLKLSYCSEIWLVPWQYRCWDACQISGWLANFKTIYHGFQNSWDFVVRQLVASLIEAQKYLLKIINVNMVLKKSAKK